eukprot:CAMPEP_0185543960 /NCGR_PEP_ID=MMETSP1381-20130426/3642_1 /TAXON_ID=298111 /ORGANISM="Pavlova sp., Strain CCMP459" /LENGTH=399 /DNA_ID=CAMNT_0028156109 /DNA_START=95 /DNA_END=1299 /DNA_ORIENTATION=+
MASAGICMDPRSAFGLELATRRRPAPRPAAPAVPENAESGRFPGRAWPCPHVTTVEKIAHVRATQKPARHAVMQTMEHKAMETKGYHVTTCVMSSLGQMLIAIKQASWWRPIEPRPDKTLTRLLVGPTPSLVQLGGVCCLSLRECVEHHWLAGLLAREWEAMHQKQLVESKTLRAVAGARAGEAMTASRDPSATLQGRGGADTEAEGQEVVVALLAAWRCTRGASSSGTARAKLLAVGALSSASASAAKGFCCGSLPSASGASAAGLAGLAASAGLPAGLAGGGASFPTTESTTSLGATPLFRLCVGCCANRGSSSGLGFSVAEESDLDFGGSSAGGFSSTTGAAGSGGGAAEAAVGAGLGGGCATGAGAGSGVTCAGCLLAPHPISVWCARWKEEAAW